MMRLTNKPKRDARTPEEREADWLRKAVYASWCGDEDEEIEALPELDEDDLDDAIEAGEAAHDEPRQLVPLRLHPCGEARRPCPQRECRMHLSCVDDNRRDGPHPGPESCALDMIEQSPSEGLTLDQIGGVLGLTRERVRQIEAEAMRKLARKADMRQLVGELVGRRKQA